MDGGYDINAISIKEIVRLIDAYESDQWDEVAFSFPEMLPYYVAIGELGGEMTDEQIVGFCFSALVVSICCKKGIKDWEFVLRHILEGIIAVKDRLEIDYTIRLIQLLFEV